MDKDQDYDVVADTGHLSTTDKQRQTVEELLLLGGIT